MLEQIQTIIDKENKYKSFWDKDITTNLKTIGYDIERPTVAYY